MPLIQDIIPHLTWPVAILFAWLLAKYLKINIDKERIQPIIAQILALILEAEEKYDTGMVKKDYVIQELEKQLDSGKKKLLSRVYGSIPRAIEWIFQTVVQPNLLRKIFK